MLNIENIKCIVCELIETFDLEVTTYDLRLKYIDCEKSRDKQNQIKRLFYFLSINLNSGGEKMSDVKFKSYQKVLDKDLSKMKFIPSKPRLMYSYNQNVLK